jgi:hypothetical protein
LAFILRDNADTNFNNKCSNKHTETVTNTETGKIDAATAINPTKSKLKTKQRKRSLPKNIKIGQNLTPPPTNVATKPVHSAETPATISKLKRKRRGRNVGFVALKSEKEKKSNTELSAAATDSKQSSLEKKQKLSASQEVDRVFDFLGLPEHVSQNLQISSQHTQPVDYSTNSALKPAIGAVEPALSDTPMKSTLLFGAAQLGSLSNAPDFKKQTPNKHTSQPKQSKSLTDRQKLKLPPLRPPHSNRRDVEKENESYNTYVNKAETEDEDLFKEIELGLDRACSCSSKNVNGTKWNGGKAVDDKPKPTAGLKSGLSCPTAPSIPAANASISSAAAVNSHAKKPVQGLSGPGQNSNSNSSTSQSTNVFKQSLDVSSTSMTLGGANATISKSSVEVTNAPNNTNLLQTNKQEFDDDEFGSDDDWNEEDLAAIDRCVAMTQCNQSQNNGKAPPAPANKPPSPPTDDEFGDDDDDEFAAFDLSAAMTQSNNNVLNSFASTFSSVCPNPAAASNVASTNSSGEFSDDDFADIDFDAIDSKVAQQMQATHPPKHVPTHNRRSAVVSNALSFTRYVIKSVEDNFNTSTKTLGVVLWSERELKTNCTDELERLRALQQNEDGSNVNATSSVNGYIHLRGIWYYTECCNGDVIHLISISGKYSTDSTALPVVLDSSHDGNQDDLVLVIHPDELITPTLISEAVKCPRLSVLQSRLGSTGLSAKSAVIGTLRHDLFERCLQDHNASRQSAAIHTRQIIRNHAETLVGCGITDQKDAFCEVMKTLPQIQNFLQKYTSWDVSKAGQMNFVSNAPRPPETLRGEFPSSDTLFSIKGLYATEEMTMCPELGLKGFVDATVAVQTKPLTASSLQKSNPTCLMPIELKTGHTQTMRSNHSAQLSVYTVLLRSRHGTASKESTGDESVSFDMDGKEMGAADSGMLLYLNEKSFNAIHVRPTLADVKQLIGQRNEVACHDLKAALPRGIVIEYNEDARVNDANMRQGSKYK